MAIADTCGGRSVEYTLFTLAYFNSVINPFIYFQHAQKVFIKNWVRLCNYFRENRTRQDNYASTGSSSNSEIEKTDSAPSISQTFRN